MLIIALNLLHMESVRLFLGPGAFFLKAEALPDRGLPLLCPFGGLRYLVGVLYLCTRLM